MKTIFKSLMVIAAAGMAFTGCSKDEGTDFIPENTKQLSINATAYAPENTRAAIGDKTDAGYPVTWDETTETFKVVEVAKEVKGYPMTEGSYENNDGVASFEFELDEAEATSSYKYYAISPAPASTSASQTTAFIHTTIPASQTQTDKVKVDPAAIVLVGESQEYTEQGNNGSVEFTFKHVTGYAKMTVKGVELTDGQIVEKVTFTAPSDIAGNLYQYKINGTDNQFGTGSSKTITVSGLNIDAAAASEGFDVWFGAAPLENITEFTVDVYVKDGIDPIATKTANASEKPLAFTAGHISAFSVTVEKAIIETETYEQITSLSNFEDGYYIIAANGYAIDNSASTSAPNTIELGAKLNGTTIAAGDTGKYNWYIKATDNGYTIRSAAEPDQYIYMSCTSDSSNNNVRVNTTKSVWNIDDKTGSDDSFYVKINPGSERYLTIYYDTNTKNYQDWRTYKSPYNNDSGNNSELKLFKKVGDNTWTGAEEEVQEPAVTQHQGTQDDPFSVADAIAKAKETGTTATSELYYIKGKISAITYTFSAQYGTATFDLKDEDSSDDAKFTAYAIKYFNNVAWVEGNTQVNIGDEAVICGKIVNYKDNTPETSQGSGYLYSLNGETGSTGGGTETPGPGDDETIVLDFNFTKNPNNWPSGSGTKGTYSYPLNGVNYQFILTDNIYCNSGYLMMKYTTAFGLPAIDGYKLTNVVAHASSSASTKTNVAITSDTNGTVTSGGNGVVWNPNNTDYSYTLTDTKASTVYYMYITAANAQITTLKLTYEPANGTSTGGGTTEPGGDGEEGGGQPETGSESTATFDFASIYSSVTGSSTETIDNKDITKQDITIVFTKGGTATQYYANGAAVRWYSGGTFTVSGGTITKVVVNYSQTANSVSADTGSYSLSNKVGTWTGNASTVKFTQSGSSGHCRITSIDVTYTK